MSKWISVDEALPLESCDALVITVNRHQMVLPYSARYRLFNAHDNMDPIQGRHAIPCTHWMPLPELPEEVK